MKGDLGGWGHISVQEERLVMGCELASEVGKVEGGEQRAV